MKAKRGLTLFLLNQFKLCGIVNLSLKFKDFSHHLIWSHNLVKEREKGKHFQNMTDGSMFMTFVCNSVVWGYEKIFIAADSLHQIAIVISLVVFLLFLVCF